MRTHCYLIIILLLNATTSSLANRFFYEQLSINEGLSQSTVKAIYRDHIGMLWIGTRDGLNRYDGHRIRTYFHDRNAQGSLPDNDIYFIIEDSLKRLWIGTHGVVSTYDRSTDTFQPQLINGLPLSLRMVFRSGGKLYSTTGNSLLIHDAETNSWSERFFYGDETNVTAAAHFQVYAPGVLLVGSRWKGLFFCDIATGKLTRVPFFSGEFILDMYRDSQNRYWVSEYGSGVLCFSDKGEVLADLRHQSGELKADKIMKIGEYQSNLWFATDGEGVLVYDEVNDKLIALERQNENVSNLRANSLYTLFLDQFNAMWLGTVRNGLLGVRKVFVNSYRNAPLNSNLGLSDATVLSFHQESEREVWIGTDGQGINLFDPIRQHFTHFPASFGTKVTAICSWDEQHLLVSLYGEGLHVLNKSTGRVRPLPLYDAEGQALFMSDWIGISLARIGNKIFIAGYDVYEYDLDQKRVRKLAIVRAGEGAVRLHISRLVPSKLVITTNQCVYAYYADTERVHCFVDVRGAGAGNINAADVDRTGTLWLGMNKGLFKVNAADKSLEQVLANEIKTVATVLADIHSSVWFSSGTRLYRYHMDRRQVFHYGKADGVRPDEFLPKSKLVSKLGDLYLGGVSGFIRIDHDIPLPDQISPGFQLLDAQLDGSLLPPSLMSARNAVPHITLPWNHTSLKLNLFVNTPALSGFPVCRYRIFPLNDAWQVLESQDISVQSLPSGNYTVMMQYELQNDQWSDPVVLTTLKVLTPWWKSWWFYLLVMLVLAAALWRYRHQAIQRARQSMEMEMQHRENELSEQKIRFLINISHELRTPLTLIYAPLRRMIHDVQTPQLLRPILTLMYKHVKNMKNMIDMVLDVRKMEMSQEDRLRRRPVDMNQLLMQLTDDFIPEAENRGITIRCVTDPAVQTLNIDNDRCEKVIMNLLMNALKFSDEGTVVKVTSCWLEDKIRISVEDQGPGVADEDVLRLFTRFYQTDHAKGGTGIGLSYARAQVELHGGTIGYSPADVKGSVFWFELPVEPVHSITRKSFEEIAAVKKDREAGDVIQPVLPEVFRKMTVLIVEDEPDLLRYMKECLSEVFRKVLTASQGEDALKKVYDYLPDLVVSDVMMPVMDGFELCRRIKTDLTVSHIPVLLLTALGDSDSSLTGYKMGADVYVAKPFGVDLLLAILNNLMRNRDQLRKQYATNRILLSTADITFSNADEKFLKKLTSMVDDRLDDAELRIDDLASEMAMSRTSFYSKVKTITGMSANNFIIDYKIKKAMAMLADPDITIQEVASNLGFVNQRYFSTVFKNVSGTTPSKWREENEQS
jgi:signal transduction histidine kinase/DNA-binding response OmpR family regulator/ligand-binding sensor domain-containing protein